MPNTRLWRSSLPKECAPQNIPLESSKIKSLDLINRCRYLVGNFRLGHNEFMEWTHIEPPQWHVKLYTNPSLTVDDSENIPITDYDDICVAITRYKYNKSAAPDALPAKLLNYGYDELTGCFYQLLHRIYSDESMTDNWNLRVFCSIHKKGYSTIYAIYHGIRFPASGLI